MSIYSTNNTLHHYLVMNPDVAAYIGEQLYGRIAVQANSADRGARSRLTQQDCVAYIHTLIMNYTPTRSIINDGLPKLFPEVRFIETYDALNEMDTDFTQDISYLSFVDYLGYVGEKAFGIQIKLTTANRATDRSNFGNYSVSERMKSSFADFTEDFSGKVFIVFSLDGEIGNPEIVQEIAGEIERLQA